jgi:hypothetical protein
MYVGCFRISFPAILDYEIDHAESDNNKEEDGDAYYEVECVINRVY